MPDFHVAVGERVEFSKTVGETDVYLFAGITGDFAPNHVNEAHMRKSAYGGRIAHGALLVGYMSTTSTMMCAKSFAADSNETPVSLGYDRVRFLKGVKLGETITVRYTVTAIEPERRRARARVEVTDEAGELCAVAEHHLKWVKNAS
jgi:acyl dehydratase